MLIDSHAHIYNEYYENIDEVIIEAKKNNVLKIINCATSIDSIEEVIQTSKKHNIYYALGIHPEELDKVDDELKDKFVNFVKENIGDKLFVAIGEIGLDYYYSKENKEEQIKLLDFQLSVAESFNKPVIIHSREATLDTINILKKHKLRGVIHCFSGSLETARDYIKLGYKLGIGGLITFKNSNLKNYIDKIGIENIILETDSPYMTPVPFRGQKNEPKYLIETAKFISETLNISLSELEEITTKNCAEIFDIDDLK